MRKLFIKIAVLTLAVCMLSMSLAGCSSSALMTLMLDGKEYTITQKEFSYLMKNEKYTIFKNNNLTTASDTAATWSKKTEDGSQTYDELYTDVVVSQAKTLLIEKYLFDKYDCFYNDETLANYKKDIKSMTGYYGGQGAFKQYWGYSTSELYDFTLAGERTTAIMDYLYGDNGIEVPTAEELEEYYQENFVGYLIIKLDMENKIKVDDEGNRVLATTEDDDGNIVESDAYEVEELTDEEKEAKQLLPDLIIAELDYGADFGTLALQYSDEYYSTKYPEGLFVYSDSAIYEDTAVITAISTLEVGKYTDAISVSNGEYTYIIKRIPLKDKAYKDENYVDFFSAFEEDVEYTKYYEKIDEYTVSIDVDTEMLAGFNMTKTFLTPAVNTKSDS